MRYVPHPHLAPSTRSPTSSLWLLVGVFRKYPEDKGQGGSAIRSEAMGIWGAVVSPPPAVPGPTSLIFLLPTLQHKLCSCRPPWLWDAVSPGGHQAPSHRRASQVLFPLPGAPSPGPLQAWHSPLTSQLQGHLHQHAMVPFPEPQALFTSLPRVFPLQTSLLTEHSQLTCS